MSEVQKKSTKQNDGNFNLGRLAGNIGKFARLSKTPNKGVSVLNFQLSTRDNLGNYSDIPLVAWGKEAEALSKEADFKDFMEVQYSVGQSKVGLANGHSLNIPTLNVYKHKMIKKASK